MARGWESKSVESQMDSAEQARKTSTPQDTEVQNLPLIRERENLLLSRVRVLHQLEATVNIRYQQMLRKGLADLDSRIAVLDQSVSPRTRSS
jgi:hypothetical protein